MKLKYALILALGFALGHVSYSVMQASIQPTSPFFQPGPVSETDNQATVLEYHLNMKTGVQSVWLYPGTGTVSGSNASTFTPGNIPPVVMWFNAGAGTWTASNGAGGTLTGPQITALNNIQTGVANAVVNPAESFAVSNNVLGSGSTQYTWPANSIP